MKLTPRPIQNRALDELWDWFEAHHEGHPIVEACVSAGKSLLIALLIKRALAEWTSTRVVVIVPSKELLVQNVQELINDWPEADVGIYSAAVKMKQLGRTITYATIGSIYKEAHRLGRVDLILADEAHLIKTKESGMWRRFIADVQKYGSPGVRVIGWTGTPFDGKGVWITHGESPLFTHVATRITMREMLDLGYLAPLTTVETRTKIDASEVPMRGDDYDLDKLAEVSDRDELVQATCDEIVELGALRKKWLGYCVTVEHAHHVCAALKQRGIAAAVVWGDMSSTARDETIKAFRNGQIRCLVSVAALTTGFSVKGVDFIFLLRTTKSPVLYVQIAGRGVRCLGADLAESIRNGKANCLWADFTETTASLGPVDAIKGRLPNKRSGGTSPFRLCDQCGSRNHASASECSSCGFKFPPPERIKHGARASAAAVLSDQVEQMQTSTVNAVHYRRYDKPGSKPSLLVEYFDGVLRVAQEWVCLEHFGSPRLRAEQWWSGRSKIDAIPSTVDDAVEWLDYDKNILRAPSAVILNKQAKYPVIVGFEWEQKQ